MHQELDKSHRRVRNLRKEKNILLDRLSVLERRNSASGTDSEGTVSSDNDSDSSVMTRIRTRQIIALRDSALHAAKEAARANSQGQGAKTSRTSATTQKRGPNTKSNSTSFSATKESKLSGPISAPVASTITNVGSATQKPKRIHQSNKPRADLNKVRKVVTLPKDENGAVKLPVTIGILTVWSIGYVVHDREAFHNERYIWPVGYKVSRSYNSMVDPTKQTVYTCSVIDDGDAPKFQIDAEDQPESPIIAGTATGAWTHIVKAANLIRRRDHSNSASGPDYYGFSHATIAKMIQDLPNADKCTSYIMHRFEEIPPAPVSTPTTSVTTAGTNEKRKISSIARGKKSKPAESQEDGLEGKDKASQDTGNVGDIDDTEDDDAYASLGTPGKKKVRVASPKIRQAGFGEIGSATMSMETEDIMMVTNIGNSGQKKLTMEEDEDTLSESESDPRLSTATRPSENDTPVANDVAAVEATESGSPGSDVDIGDEGEIEVEVDIVGYSGMTVEDDT
ncbi:hypothetical protein BGZ83_003625 [Gryganskiella cystojenkinii]|nr:hypothetical protein BGZ83_003625 [Gryganskiella cystojenkinii]